jgi:hypothetical protein
MKSRPDRTSPWGVRLFFEEREFEAMMIDLSLRSDLPVFEPGIGVDVDRVLLKGFGLEADYVSLEKGILGRTLFTKKGIAKIEIARELAEEAETDQLARRRLRTTLAHEAGHVACHQGLFLGDTETLSLFGSASVKEKPAILCREESGGVYRGEWWEYQANKCMAALLLPKFHFIPQLEDALKAVGVVSFKKAIVTGQDEAVIRSLANTFDVSWQAVLLRLQELGFAPSAGTANQQVMTL